jgi:hypothetical protein
MMLLNKKIYKIMINNVEVIYNVKMNRYIVFNHFFKNLIQAQNYIEINYNKFVNGKKETSYNLKESEVDEV